MASVGNGLYVVPDSLVGQTASQLPDYGLDLTDLRNQLGNTPLVKGQTVTAFGEGQTQNYLNRFWTPTTATAGAEGALAASKPLTEQAYAQRGVELQGQKQPLMDRYQSLLDQITGQQNKDLTQQGNVLSQEYGKRGIPLSSGAYQQDLANKDTNINQFYTGQSKDVTFERENKLRDISNFLAELPIQKAQELNQIDQQIAQLKAKGASEQLMMALDMYKQQKADEYNNKLLDLQKQEFQLKKYQAEQPAATNLSNQFASVGEGSTLYDLLNRNAVYTAPKTYKPESGSGYE